MEGERGNTLGAWNHGRARGNTLRAYFHLISTGRAMDARPAVFPWSGGRGFTAERARMGESTDLWVHLPTKVGYIWALVTRESDVLVPPAPPLLGALP